MVVQRNRYQQLNSKQNAFRLSIQCFVDLTQRSCRARRFTKTSSYGNLWHDIFPTMPNHNGGMRIENISNLQYSLHNPRHMVCNLDYEAIHFSHTKTVTTHIETSLITVQCESKQRLKSKNNKRSNEGEHTPMHGLLNIWHISAMFGSARNWRGLLSIMFAQTKKPPSYNIHLFVFARPTRHLRINCTQRDTV